LWHHVDSGHRDRNGDDSRQLSASALDIRQNELENTISLLVGHLDQQLEEFGLIQKDSLAQI
jgi:hypothetical protein